MWGSSQAQALKLTAQTQYWTWYNEKAILNFNQLILVNNQRFIIELFPTSLVFKPRIRHDKSSFSSWQSAPFNLSEFFCRWTLFLGKTGLWIFPLTQSMSNLENSEIIVLDQHISTNCPKLRLEGLMTIAALELSISASYARRVQTFKSSRWQEIQVFRRRLWRR